MHTINGQDVVSGKTEGQCVKDDQCQVTHRGNLWYLVIYKDKVWFKVDPFSQS